MNVGSSLRKSVVPLYRIFSMISLYGILLGIVLYGVLFAFYLTATHWVAPFAVNPSDTQVLGILSQVSASEATINTLQLDYQASDENIRFNREQIAELTVMERNLDGKVSRQSREWLDAAETLKQYDNESKQNLATVQKDVNHSEELRALVTNDLQTGLITNEDALSSYSSIDALAVNMTAAKVAESDLQDSIRQHKMADVTSLTVEGQRVALLFQIGQLASQIRTDEQHMATDQQTVALLSRAIQVAKASPFFDAQNAQLGVVPYDPKSTVKAGDSVYDCVLGVMLCRQVGTIAAAYPNELIFENPLTKTNTRGYIIRLSVTQAAMRSKSLMVGRRPLLF